GDWTDVGPAGQRPFGPGGSPARLTARFAADPGASHTSLPLAVSWTCASNPHFGLPPISAAVRLRAYLPCCAGAAPRRPAPCSCASAGSTVHRTCLDRRRKAHLMRLHPPHAHSVEVSTSSRRPMRRSTPIWRASSNLTRTFGLLKSRIALGETSSTSSRLDAGAGRGRVAPFEVARG